MRLLLIIFVMLFSSNLTPAQNYIKMVNDSIFWDVHYQEMGYICSGYGGGGKRFHFGNDTVINEKNYTRVWAYNLVSVYFITDDADCPPHRCETVSYPTNYYVHEDTLGKIYVYYSQNMDESLLFDYNLLVGDSIVYGGVTLIVNSISDITTYDSITRRLFMLEDEFSIWNGCYFIEGLGGPAGPFSYPFPVFEFGSWLKCWGYFNSNINDCWDFMTGLPYYPKNGPDISIYPNPAENILYISDISQIVSLRIIDLFGNECVKKNQLTSNSINIENLAKGVYFVEMELLNKQTIKVKLIKTALNK